ncbi:hypothetical protein C8J55DRAFT_554275 [Lentinula edodes]|uniref:ENTH domain-containing protein n=1 Tax=Lentinula lateritia TaxID=40482 RepID=A0A9W9B0R4_9AGAR|nr:hypothetical protein C8J55DRAFT_554275 [Lentinula edodes]
MDRLEALGSTLSQITLYDIKSYYEQAKNVVLNVSEIEAKVREATNDDPWGASSTLMQDIASRTFNYPEFNEIMPSIYSRFMEKEAKQWRQIYKSLQLLEYLIKNGSERVVDDARAHISTIKMLRNFHYIDDKGKDQGINVRNRSKEIVELLSDVENIRTERRKAKANRSKYIGTGSDGLRSSSGGSRYGGFGSDSLGYNGGGSSSYNSGDRYGSGERSSGSYGGGSSSFRDSGSRGFEEYNAGDDEVVATSPTRNNSLTVSSPSSARFAPTRKSAAPEPAPAPVPEVDLLGGLDDDTFSSGTTSNPPFGLSEKALPAVGAAPVQNSVGIDDDDFADFQAAPVTPHTTVAPFQAAPAAAHKMNLMEMLNSTSATPARPQSMSYAQPQAPPMQTQGLVYGSGMGMGSSGMGMAGMATGGMHRPSPSLSNQSSFGGVPTMRPMSTTSVSSSGSTMNRAASVASSKPASSANFDDLWSMSLGSKPSTPAAGAAVVSKSIKDIQNEKASAGLWGSGPAKPQQPTMGNAFGSFGSSGGATSSSGGDDLLL